MQASPPAMPKMPYNTGPKKDYIKLVVIHAHSYMSRWLVRALGADPLRIPITRWNRWLGLALLPVPLALLLRPLGLFAESLGLELVPVPFNVLQSAEGKSVRNIRSEIWEENNLLDSLLRGRFL